MNEPDLRCTEIKEPCCCTEMGAVSMVQPCCDENEKGAISAKDLLLGVCVIWCIELVLGFLLVVWLGDPNALESYPIPLMATALASGAATFYVSWYFVCRKYRRSLVEGFMLWPISKRNLMAAVLIGIVMSVVLSFAGSRYSTGEHLFSKMLDQPSGMLSLTIMVLILPFVEEFYYRGFLYPVLRKYCGVLAAIGIVTVWFALAHSLQSLEDLIAIPLVASAGAVFTVQRWWSGSLTVPIITHWTYNFCLVLYTAAVE